MPDSTAPRAPVDPIDPIMRRHLRLGWWGLLTFIALGITLETILGLRLAWYVDELNATRRLMFRLGHAHGALLSLVNVVFALTVRALDHERLGPWPSRALVLATVLIPLGFLGGGWVIHDGDPGLPIFLVPLGGLALMAAVLQAARAVSSVR